jgi:hypothetical protein
MARTGRPKVYTGTQIGIKLPVEMDLKLRTEAQKTGKSISDLVRSTLQEKWGNGKEQGERE